MGVYGMSVITSVVAENTSRVISLGQVDEKTVADQIDAVFEDISVDAVKIGMLCSVGIIETVARKLRKYAPPFTVLDPVLSATSGGSLAQSGAAEKIAAEILPLCFLVTPNIPEAEILTGIKINNIADMKNAAAELLKTGVKNVLVKGGHLDGDAVDILYDGKTYTQFSCPKVDSSNTHGTGCTLSSAITARLALGDSAVQAVAAAKDYITNAIKMSFEVGKNGGPVNHFYEYYKMKGI